MTICRTPLDHDYWAAYTARPRRPLLPPERASRVTLRLPSSLKGGVEASAARERVSLDAWVARALARSVDPRVQA